MNNNPPLLNDPPPMFSSSMNKPNNMMLNNSLLNPSLMRQHPMSQQHNQQQQQPSFFPSASQRQFQQQPMDMLRGAASNFNQQLPTAGMNYPRPSMNHENYSNFQTDKGICHTRPQGIRPEMTPNMMSNANFNMQMNNQIQNKFNSANPLNKMLGSMNAPNQNSALLANPQMAPFNMNPAEQHNSFFQNQQQQMFMQQKMNFNNPQMPMRQSNNQQDNQPFHFPSFNQNQQKQVSRGTCSKNPISFINFNIILNS